MPKYRKRPLVIDAHQWDGDWPAVIQWLASLTEQPLLVPPGQRPGIVREGSELVLMTIHGDPAKARLGDWVVPEPVPDRFYPINNAVFAASYEPAT